MRFRPCIDLHEGRVKQIVGGSLRDGEAPRTNFDAGRPPAYYADLYRRDGLQGGHVIMLGPGNEAAAAEALAAFPGGLQVGGGIDPGNAASWLDRGAAAVIATSYVFRGGSFRPERQSAGAVRGRGPRAPRPRPELRPPGGRPLRGRRRPLAATHRLRDHPGRARRAGGALLGVPRARHAGGGPAAGRGRATGGPSRRGGRAGPCRRPTPAACAPWPTWSASPSWGAAASTSRWAAPWICSGVRG